MSFFDCLNDAMDEGSADKGRGERAQKMWKDRADTYERGGSPRHTAEARAAEDVKEAFKREAGEARNSFLADMATMRRIEAETAKMDTPGITARAEVLHYETLGITRYYMGQINQYIKDHHRDLIGRIKKPGQQLNVMRELHGDSTGDVVASGYAKAVGEVIEDLRLRLNELGANIGKMENYGVRHDHDAASIRKAEFEKWFADTKDLLAWKRINDPLTGRPMQGEGSAPPSDEFKRSYLKVAHDNIVFGRDSTEAVFGRQQGENMAVKWSHDRVLHFDGADNWVEYNKLYGSGTPHAAIVSQISSMARDYAHMRAFGRRPKMGIDYAEQILVARARKTDDQAFMDKAKSDAIIARRMMNIMRAHRAEGTAKEQYVARFMSNTRMVLTAAQLDRAIFANLADMASLQMAAQRMKMGGDNIMLRQLGLAKMMSKEDLLRAKWSIDTLTDAGGVMERFITDSLPSHWAEQMANTSIRIQGLAAWTDRARRNWQETEWGNMASQAHLSLDRVEPELQQRLRSRGISDSDWADLTAPENLFTAGNGATFVVPFWWRAATKMDQAKADDLLIRVQSMIEEGMERAVATNSPLVRAYLGEGKEGETAGTVSFEIFQSAKAYKSFVMSFSRNQYLAIKSLPNNTSRALYAAQLLAMGTAIAAVGMQVNDLWLGRDPQTMDMGFWGRALLRSGGLGVMGDIISTGEASWGGGFPSYVAGPVPQLVGDVYNIGRTPFDAIGDLVRGDEVDTGFGKLIARAGKRYTPMGQTPAIGVAFDRIFWDQLQLLIDPESVKAMARASKKRKKDYGGGEYWMPGSPLPGRAPNLGTAFGN